MKLDLGDDPQTRLTKLLREAEAAHARYETQTGKRDEDWPAWYARHILEQASESHM